MLSEMRERFLQMYDEAADKMLKLCASPQDPEKLDLTILHSDNISQELQDASFAYCTAFGVCMVSGARPTEPGLHVHPFVVRAALPQILGLVKGFHMELATMDPVVSIEEGLKVLAKLQIVFSTFVVAAQTHDAVHQGIMTQVLGPILGQLWGPIKFCPLFNELDDSRVELDRMLQSKKRIIAICVSTPLFDTWVQAIKESGQPLPWWLADEIIAEHKAMMADKASNSGAFDWSTIGASVQ